MEEAQVVESQEYKFDALQILKGATWFGVGSALGMGLEFVAQGLIAARLGPADFGLLSVGLQVFMIAMTLAVFALPGAVTYFIPNSWTEEGSDRAGQVVATSLWVSFIASLLVGAILYMAAQLISNLLGEPGLVVVLRMLAIALPAAAMVSMIAGVLRGLQMSREASLLTSTYERAVRFGLIVAALLLGFGLRGAVMAYAPASLVVMLLGLRDLRRSKLKIGRALPTMALLGDLFSYSVPLLASQLLSSAKSAIQPIMLTYFLDSRATGIFAVATLVSGSLGMVMVAFNFLYLPVVSGISIKNNLERVRNLYRLVTSWGLLAILPIGLLLIAFPQPFLALFGHQYAEGEWALRLIMVGTIISVATGSVGATLLATRKTFAYLIVHIVSTVGSIAMGLLLIPEFGLMGAALSQMLSVAFTNGLSLWMVYRMYGMHPFGREYIHMFGVGVGLLAAMYPLIQWLIGYSYWLIVLVGPIYVLLTLFVLFRFHLLSAESQATLGDFLKNVWQQVRIVSRQLGVARK